MELYSPPGHLTNVYLCSKLLDSAITVKVGDDLKEFSVHHGLICHFSAFFRGAMRSHCREAQTRTFELPKVEVPTFESFSAWLYTRQLRGNTEEDSSTSGIRLRLAKLWVFGDTYGIPDLQNAALGALRQSLNSRNTMPAPTVIAYVYDNTNANASIRKLLLDLVLETKDFQQVFDPAKDKDREVLWDGQFCQDLLFQYASRYGDKVRDLKKTEDAWKSRDECDYHVHYDKKTIGAQTASGEPQSFSRGRDSLLICSHRCMSCCR